MSKQRTSATAWENAIENPFQTQLEQSSQGQTIRTYVQGGTPATRTVYQSQSYGSGAAAPVQMTQGANVPLVPSKTTTVEQRFVTTSYSQQPTPHLANDSGLFTSTQFATPSASFQAQGPVQTVNQNSLLSNNQSFEQNKYLAQAQAQPATRVVIGQTIKTQTTAAQNGGQANGVSYHHVQADQTQGQVYTVRQSAPRQANQETYVSQAQANYPEGTRFVSQNVVQSQGPAQQQTFQSLAQAQSQSQYQTQAQYQYQTQPIQTQTHTVTQTQVTTQPQTVTTTHTVTQPQTVTQTHTVTQPQTTTYYQGSVNSLNQGSRPSLRIEHEAKVVSERLGEPRVVKEEEGQKRVLSTQTLAAHVVEERTVAGQTKVVSEVEGQHTRMSEHRKQRVQDVEVEVVQRDKIVEIIKEKPVRVERYVDVPYDVIVDVPVTRTIEKERITNIVKEIPVEKVVEVPINQIIETPVEKIVERPVEIQKFVEVPVERVVERPYEVVREQITYQDRFVDIDEREVGKYPQFERLPTTVKYEERPKPIDQPRYVDNIVEQVRSVEKQKVIEVPREKIVENRQQVVIDRPVQVEKVIHREVEVPIERQVYKDVAVNVEVPRYRENVIEVPVPVERVVEREVQVPVDRVVEKKVRVEQVVENLVEHVIEIPIPHEEVIEEVYEQIEEHPYEVEQAQLRPQEKVIRRSAYNVRKVEVPVEYPIEKLIARPVQSTIERKVNKYTESPVEATLERPVMIERITEVPKIVERIVEVPVEVIREQIRFVEKIIEKPVYIDTVIDKFVEVIVEKIVEVPVEKIVEVEVEIVTEVPQIEEVNVETELLVEGLNEDYKEEPVQETRQDFEDELLAQQIKLRQLELDSLARKNKELVAELQATQQEIDRLAANIANDDERENFLLLARLAELNSRYRMEVEHSEGLRTRRSRAVKMVDGIVRPNPVVEGLKEKIVALVARNQQLCAQLRTTSEEQLKKVRYSQYRA